MLYVIPTGIVGARIYHVIDYWWYYKEDLVEVLRVWHGGLGIYGAILGGILGLWVYTLKNKKTFQAGLDLICIGLPVGQAIGRLGNYFNQELYGKETKAFWGIIIEGKKYQPLFLFEAILNMGLFLVMVLLSRKERNLGFFAGFYFVGYGVIRFCLDFLRLELWKIGGIGVSQVISIIVFIWGIWLIFLKSKRAK